MGKLWKLKIDWLHWLIVDLITTLSELSLKFTLSLYLYNIARNYAKFVNFRQTDEQIDDETSKNYSRSYG